MAKMPEFDARDLTKGLTVVVTIRYDWRYLMGLWLLRLGAKLCGCKLRTEKSNDNVV